VLIVACSSLKGGVGKTTIAVNTAGALQEFGEQCAVLDVDPQQSATRWAPEGVTVEVVDNAKSAGWRSSKRLRPPASPTR